VDLKLSRSEQAVRWCEFAGAGLITLLIVYFHIQFWRSAGPLWRDEVCSFNVATAGSLSELSRLLPFENQPLLHYLILRGWCGLSLGATDIGLRALGLVIGLLLTGAIWLACWLLNRTPPLWALTIFGLNPYLFRADSLRPHGLGLVWIVLTFAFVWQLTVQVSPRRSTILFATLAAVLSVQTVFIEVIVVGAICAASATVFALNRNWRAIVLPLGIGLVSAASLIPYLGMIREAQQWNGIRAVVHSLGYTSAAFLQILTFGDVFIASVFVAIVLLAIACTVVPRLKERLSPVLAHGSERFTFAAVASLLAAVATFAFLWLLKFPLQDRYYLPLLAVVALSITLVVSALRGSIPARATSLFACLVLTTAFFPHAHNHTRIRLTNCDLAATAVAEAARADDLVLVTRFAYGITFQRYYRGSVAWHAIPDIGDYSLFRWDLVKNAMEQPDPMHDLLVRAESTLRSAHRVFLVGPLGMQTREPSVVERSLNASRQQLIDLLNRHAQDAQNYSLPNSVVTDPVERLNVTVASGWR